MSPTRLDYDVGSMENFISDAAARGIEIEVNLLESRQIVADDEFAEILSVPKGTPLYQNQRLFSRRGHAAFLETETVIAERCKDILNLVAETNTENLQKQRYSPYGQTAEIVIRMRAIETDEAEILGLMPYQSGMEQEQVVYDNSGTAICFSRQIWRGEIAQFTARAIMKS